MPPAFKFSKEEIISTALLYVKKNGIDALTARSLAKALGTSTKPIFGLFAGMDELKNEVTALATAKYNEYFASAFTQKDYPVYKATGLAYIRFAAEEKELFKLLFMCDRTEKAITDGKEELKPVLELLQKNLGISENNAYIMHLENWIFVHGIATMLATGYLKWDNEFIENAITDVFSGLKHRFGENKNDCN